MEERSDGILLRPTGPAIRKLTWEETARAMAATAEDWSPWDAAAADAIADLPWAALKKPRAKKPTARSSANARAARRR